MLLLTLQLILLYGGWTPSVPLELYIVLSKLFFQITHGLIIIAGKNVFRLRSSEFIRNWRAIQSYTHFYMFPDHPEFYAHYLMKNVKNDNVYATNFRLNVLCVVDLLN